MAMIPLSDLDSGRACTSLRAYAAKQLLDARRVASRTERASHESEADALMELANRIEATTRIQHQPVAATIPDRAEATHYG